jgi:hypothetical protein
VISRSLVRLRGLLVMLRRFFVHFLRHDALLVATGGPVCCVNELRSVPFPPGVGPVLARRPPRKARLSAAGVTACRPRPDELGEAPAEAVEAAPRFV